MIVKRLPSNSPIPKKGTICKHRPSDNYYVLIEQDQDSDAYLAFGLSTLIVTTILPESLRQFYDILPSGDAISIQQS